MVSRMPMKRRGLSLIKTQLITRSLLVKAMIIHRRYIANNRLVFECSLLGIEAVVLNNYNKALFVGPAVITWVGKNERNSIVNQMIDTLASQPIALLQQQDYVPPLLFSQMSQISQMSLPSSFGLPEMGYGYGAPPMDGDESGFI